MPRVASSAAREVTDPKKAYGEHAAPQSDNPSNSPAIAATNRGGLSRESIRLRDRDNAAFDCQSNIARVLAEQARTGSITVDRAIL